MLTHHPYPSYFIIRTEVKGSNVLLVLLRGGNTEHRKNMLPSPQAPHTCLACPHLLQAPKQSP